MLNLCNLTSRKSKHWRREYKLVIFFLLFLILFFYFYVHTLYEYMQKQITKSFLFSIEKKDHDFILNLRQERLRGDGQVYGEIEHLETTCKSKFKQNLARLCAHIVAISENKSLNIFQLHEIQAMFLSPFCNGYILKKIYAFCLYHACQWQWIFNQRAHFHILLFQAFSFYLLSLRFGV